MNTAKPPPKCAPWSARSTGPRQGWSRRAMLDLSPKPVLLPVPTEYRHFVIRKWNSDYLVGMLPGVFALIIVALRGFKGIHFEWWHIAVIPALLAAWLFHSRKQWYSGINKNGVRLIYYSRSFWSTRDILW